MQVVLVLVVVSRMIHVTRQETAPAANAARVSFGSSVRVPVLLVYICRLKVNGGIAVMVSTTSVPTYSVFTRSNRRRDRRRDRSHDCLHEATGRRDYRHDHTHPKHGL